MNNLTKYVAYVAIGTGIAMGAGCSSREPEVLPKIKITGIEPVYDGPTIEVIGIEPVYDEPKQKDNKTEDYKR
jgi:hypothetical protein